MSVGTHSVGTAQLLESQCSHQDCCQQGEGHTQQHQHTHTFHLEALQGPAKSTATHVFAHAQTLATRFSSFLPAIQLITPWSSTADGGGGSGPLSFLQGSRNTEEKQAFTQGLRNEGGLTLSNKDQLRALLGLAVINLTALGGSAQAMLSPQGPGSCDHNAYERCANCVTSAPFVMVGVHALKKRNTLDGKVWGASLMGVGMASCGFHASTGKWRTLARQLDYWSIAMSSNLMLRAVVPNVPPALTVASMALTPFKPFLVSFCNSAAMEYKFLARATQNKELRRTQRLHASTVLVGLGVFFMEEYFPRFPFIHAMWHCLSAASVASVNDLVKDAEEQRLLCMQATPLVL